MSSYTDWAVVCYTTEETHGHFCFDHVVASFYYKKDAEKYIKQQIERVPRAKDYRFAIVRVIEPPQGM